MNLKVNDQNHPHKGDGTIIALLAELGATPEHSAVTVNGELVFSKSWESFQLSDNDTVEVLTFVGGG